MITFFKVIAGIAIVAVFLFIWVMVVANRDSKKFIALRDSVLSKMSKFKPTDFHGELAFDKINGALAVIRAEEKPDGIRIIMIDPKSIIEFECIVNGHSSSVTKNTNSPLLRAAVGGVLLGGVGAVVASISGQGNTKTVTTEVKDFKLRISLDRPDVQLLMVPFFTEESMMLWNSFLSIAMRRDELLEQSPPFAYYEEQSVKTGVENKLSTSSVTSIDEKLANIELLRAEGIYSDEEAELSKSKLNTSA